MVWNHRVMKHSRAGALPETWYTIHEVYYPNVGEAPDSWTQDAVEPMGETVEELRECLAMMLLATEHPVLEIGEDGKLKPLDK